MNMSFVDMGGKHKLVLATQYFFCHLYTNLMSFLWKCPLQRFSFPYSVPPLSMFRAGREHRFQGQNRLELASLYQRIRDSEIKIFQRSYCTDKSIRNPSSFHSPQCAASQIREEEPLFVSYFFWVIVLKSLHLTDLSIAKFECNFLTTTLMLLK